MWITWKHEHTELANATIEKKVDIFEAKVWGWTLHVADLMINGGRNQEDKKDVSPIPHAGFACLQVILSYFEMIARYIEGDRGRDRSRDFFTRGFRYVFPEIDQYPYLATSQFLSNLYAGARCGLYHMSMTAKGIVISGNGPAVQYGADGNNIILNPHELPRALKQHLAGYCQRLRDPSEEELRANFDRRFSRDHEM